MSVLVTRPGPEGARLVAQIRQQGVAAYHTPLVAFASATLLSNVIDPLRALHVYAVVVALSPRVAPYIQQAMQKIRSLWPVQADYYAIGAASAKALGQLCGQPVEYPTCHSDSEALLELPRLSLVKGERILLLRGQGGRTLITETLAARGAEVVVCECYQRILITYNGIEQAVAWQRAGVDTVVVTSSEALQRLYALVPPPNRAWLLKCCLVVVSQRIAALAAHLGWRDRRVAEAPGNEALLRALPFR